MKSFYISMLQKFSNGIKHVGFGQILFLILSSQTFENLIYTRNYFSGQLNSFLLKEIVLQGKLLSEEAISILSLHLIHGSCLMFATPKQCTMNSLIITLSTTFFGYEKVIDLGFWKTPCIIILPMLFQIFQISKSLVMRQG